MGRRIAIHVARNAAKQASIKDTFSLSPLLGVQRGEYLPYTYRALRIALGSLGLTGYVEQERLDMGNGLQDYGRPSVVITERLGAPTSVRQMGKGAVSLLSFEPEQPLVLDFSD